MLNEAWTLIEAGVLIDGTGGPPQRRAGVLVRDRTIESVGRLDALRLPTEATVERIDASQHTVIPGLIDAHLHLGYCGHRSIQGLEWPNSVEYAAIRAVGNAQLALNCGITSALDVGSRGHIGVAIKQAIVQDGLPGPNLRVSGQILNSTAGCVDLWPDWIEVAPHARLGVAIDSVDDVRRVVRAQVKSGVDNVKVEASGTGVHPLRPAIEATMSPAELSTAVETAHTYGVSVAAHAERMQGIKNAIRAGVDTVQHGTFLDDEVLDLLEERPTSRLVFTTGVYDGIINLGPAIGYPAAAYQHFVEAWPVIVGNVRKAYERGVPFAAGSDCGGQSHPHGRYARNVTLFVRECGLPVEHAIRAVTSYAAAAAWFENVGTLEAGRQADVVAVQGDLTQRIEAIEDEACIALVMQSGRVVKPIRESVGPTRR
jgi:imidazolonepropionase-like amidohydrolase